MADRLQPDGPDLILRLWERIQGLPPHRQAVEMLVAAEPGQPREDIAKLAIGARDARLLALRERLFGSQLKSLVDCPQCGERIEMGFRVDAIRTAAAVCGEQTDRSEIMLLTEAGWRVEYRLPTSADLAAIADGSDPDEARNNLLRRCVLAVGTDLDAAGVQEQGDVGGDAGAPDLGQLPVQLLERIVEAMSEADPQADVELLLSCPVCGHRWQAAFDIVTYLAAEIDAWARRLLADVARLARGYGWREADILAMTPARRHAYLELLESL